VWEVVDPDGRRVVLTFERWRHILDRRPALKGNLEDVLATVAHPVARRRGHRPNEEWFYGAGFGPSRWFRVVVHYEKGTGSITTAFPRRRVP
jgi:hypothetical protein